MILFFIIFGVIGVSFFKGKYYECLTEGVTQIEGYESIFVLETKWDCINTGGEWRRMYYNFDNIYQAMSTLFIMANVGGWSDVMYVGTKVTDIDYYWRDQNHPYWVFFFIGFMVIGSFFLLNLFIGVVFTNFKRETDQLGGYNLMNDNQRELVDIHYMVLKSKPVISPKTGNCLYQVCLYIIKDSKWFENFIYTSIILNTVILSIKWGA
jgi:Ion transport protein